MSSNLQCFSATCLKGGLICIKIVAEKVDTGFDIKIVIMKKENMDMGITIVE